MITLTADYLLDYCQTPADHPWPGSSSAVPTKGKAYGRADPHGFIQLDLCGAGRLGHGCGLQADGQSAATWRPSSTGPTCWPNTATSAPASRPGTATPTRKTPSGTRGRRPASSLVLQFLDDVIRLGYRGKDDACSRPATPGERYLRDVLLPQWSRDPTLGHHFWDWLQPGGHAARCPATRPAT